MPARPGRATDARTLPPIAVVRAAAMARSAGARPNTMAAATEIAAANPTTRTSGANTSGQLSGRAEHLVRQQAAAPPADPQRRQRHRRAASTRLSVRHWRTRRARVAPSDRRMLRSRACAAPRASSRFAMFAQVTSSTSTTIPVSAKSASENRARRPENPCANGSSASVCGEDARAVLRIVDGRGELHQAVVIGGLQHRLDAGARYRRAPGRPGSARRYSASPTAGARSIGPYVLEFVW